MLEDLKDSNLKIVGIAGPGDPLSDPDKLLAFISGLRKRFGNMYEVCISTNGLNAYRYTKQLKELEVNYMTLTINSIDVSILEELVEWVHVDGITYKGKEAAKRLNEAQMKSLRSVVESGMTCKVNTVIVPDVNQYELINLIHFIKQAGAVKSNLIPLIPVKGTRFGKIHTLSVREYNDIFYEAGQILAQVKGCKKCRADAMYIHTAERADA